MELPPKLRLSDFVTVLVDGAPWRFRILRSSEVLSRRCLWGRMLKHIREANAEAADVMEEMKEGGQPTREQLRKLSDYGVAVAFALEREQALPSILAHLADDIVAVPNGEGVLSRQQVEGLLERPLDADFIDQQGWDPQDCWRIWTGVLMAQQMGKREGKRSAGQS